MKCLKTVKLTEDAAVYQYMIKKESEGKAKKLAKIAALNKFLRIYYARVNEAYQAKLVDLYKPLADSRCVISLFAMPKIQNT